MRCDGASGQQQPELDPAFGLAASLSASDEDGRRKGVRCLRASSVLRTRPPPGLRGQPPTAVTLGNFDLLVAELDKLYGKRMRIWITEYGYQTNPPDRLFGVSNTKQASYLTRAVALARRHPKVDMFLWFLLRDEDRIEGWQSGLMTFDGLRKSSWNAFRRAATS